MDRGTTKTADKEPKESIQDNNASQEARTIPFIRDFHLISNPAEDDTYLSEPK